MSDLSDEIAAAAGKPAAASKGDASLTNRSLADLAAGDEALRKAEDRAAANTAANVPGFGVRFQKIKPGGAN